MTFTSRGKVEGGVAGKETIGCMSVTVAEGFKIFAGVIFKWPLRRRGNPLRLLAPSKLVNEPFREHDKSIEEELVWIGQPSQFIIDFNSCS